MQNFRKKWWIGILILSFGQTFVHAQEKGEWRIGMQAAVTVGLGSADNRSRQSFNDAGGGLIIDLKYFVSDQFAISFNTGWQALSSTTETYLIGSIDQIPHESKAFYLMQTIPISLGVDYYFYKGTFRPYVGIGVGTHASIFSVNLEEEDIVGGRAHTSMWSLGLNERLGCEYEVLPRLNVYAELNFNQVLNLKGSKEVIMPQRNSLQNFFYMSLGLGVRYSF